MKRSNECKEPKLTFVIHLLTPIDIEFKTPKYGVHMIAMIQPNSFCLHNDWNERWIDGCKLCLTSNKHLRHKTHRCETKTLPSVCNQFSLPLRLNIYSLFLRINTQAHWHKFCILFLCRSQSNDFHYLSQILLWHFNAMQFNQLRLRRKKVENHLICI